MTLRGTNQEFARPYNRRLVLETIRLAGPVSRADIARRVGLTVQTVSNIARELEEQGFVKSTREEPRGRGYPASSLSIDPEGGFAIGVNLSPRGLQAALINLAGEVIGRRTSDLPQPTPAAGLREIGKLVASLRKVRQKGRMLGVGLAMPGPFDIESMSFVGPTTLEGWKGVPVGERLAEITGLPAFIEVDHAAAAIGERLYGVARTVRDFYYLYFGAGLGGCMVRDGNVERGANGNAGEIGHVQLVPNGEACPCGNRGCLERYLSCEAMDRRAAEIGADGWIAEAAPLMRTAIGLVENLFDPMTVIVGGLAPERVLSRLLAAAEPLPHSVAERASRTLPRVVLSSSSRDVVLLGAASLVVSGVLSPRFGLMFAPKETPPDRDPMMRQPNPEKAA